ncbi:MAG: hypothetical protein IJ666_07195 [Ruminococcus sp.]|nr:hypothetical protein [Ruminococcus sp.]
MREFTLVLCALYCFYYAKLSLKKEIPEEIRPNTFGIVVLVIIGIVSILAAIQGIIGYITK